MDDIVTSPVEFRIFSSGALKASRDNPDRKMRLHGVASSTTRDLHGDTMTQSAIDDMERAAANNLTIFLNHSYNVPEDVGGSVEKARQATKGVDHDGNPNTDLYFDIVINEANPRAVQTFEAIERGTKLGLSIGAMIPEGGATRNKNGTFIIEHVDLLETSLVGIPANPRSWVDYAVKALRGETPTLTSQLDYVTTLSPSNTTITNLNTGGSISDNLLRWSSTPLIVGENGAETVEAAACPQCGGGKNSPKSGCNSSYHSKDVEPEIIDESHSELPDSAFACVDSTGRHYPHHTSSGGVDKALLRNALARIADKSNTQCGKGHLEAHAKDLGIGDREKDIEPDLADATVKIEIDTEDGSSVSEAASDAPSSQEAQTSSPESEGGLLDETADGDDAALGDDVTRAGMDMISKQTQLIAELVAARVEVQKATEARVKAESERDQAVRERQKVLRATHQLLSRLADSPMVRKTALAEANAEFRARFEAVYDQDFLKELERTSDR